ncbi:co-chaperone DjlA [Catenovulum sediminis]|uniref:Co-chaperone protein DjlA n=1 Tax=Catenovulum sediminis TaxID=1740262 RepID=A0ABV1RK09_9ALTE|nr:co-chaperone DjlA [Catenovulum sediminis]
MSHWGKILGFIFGYMIFRIPGAVLGLIIGYYFDKGYAKALADNGGFSSLLARKASFKNRVIFFHTLFALMGHIAKASGRVTENDIALASALMDRMGLKGDIRKEAQAAYREGKKNDFPVTETVKDFRQYCFSRKDFMLIYMEIQIQAALANGYLHPNAKAILIQVGKTLGFQPTEIESFIKQAEGSSHYRSHKQQNSSNQISLDDAYQILGLSPSADDKLIKKTYKKLMSQHHPDKLSAQGLPEQALKMANEKAQDIQAAYGAIRAQRGFK